MDSSLINKLIRSEVWPLLREQGFSRFESRKAFAYRNQFVNVVSFQSFNSYTAEVLGCTTYSFGVNLGTYLIGSPGEDHIARDKSGHLKPAEYHWSFRTELKKRTDVDGFARNDIFYIHPDGRTTHACFHEVRHLLQEVAQTWFLQHNDLDNLLSRMQRTQNSDSTDELGARGLFGSYNWNQLESVLSLLKHQRAPTQDSADVALSAINRVIGNILNFYRSQSDQASDESYAVDVRALWDQLGPYQPFPTCPEGPMIASGSLAGSAWMPVKRRLPDSADDCASPASISFRKQLWPMLKSVGFSEFTERLAHRSSDHLVEVIEFRPIDPVERKGGNLPAGLFRIGVGVLWPAIAGDWRVRTNGKKEPRPLANECHVSNWLTAQVVTDGAARTIFSSSEDASAALAGTALGWLDIFRNYDSALSLFERKDLDLFLCYPMMRGYGATSSTRRLICIALLKHLLGNNAEAREYVDRAEMAIHASYPESLWPRYEAWIDQVKIDF